MQSLPASIRRRFRRDGALPLYRPERRARPSQGDLRANTRQASAQLVTVAGEPGVGKSRLVREFRAFVDWQPEGARWRQGRCLPYGDGITFWALGEIVKNQAEILESDSPRRQPRSSRAIATIGGSDGAGLAQDPPVPLVGARCPRRRRRQSDPIVRRLAALPRGRRRRPAAGPGLRGRALGRHGAARVPGVPRGLGDRPAVPHDLHDQTRSLRAPPGMGRRSTGLRNACHSPRSRARRRAG